MVRTIAALAIALAAIPAQAATTYDAFSSFNATNGAGNFFWASTTPTTAELLSPLTSCAINNTICLGLPSGSFGLPGVFKSTGIPSTSHPYQPLDRLLVHPGTNTGIGAYFVAPTTAKYSFTATLDALTNATTVGLFAVTNSGGTFNVLGTGFLDTLGETQTFNGTLDLTAGQFIGTGATNGGSFISDSTGLIFTVTRLANVSGAVPEPASWAMMIVGFGAVGTVLRRSRRAGIAPAMS